MSKRIYLNIKRSGSKATKGYILDVSRGGIGVASSETIKKGTKISIEVKDKNLPPLEGVVASSFRRDKKNYAYRLGIKLTFLSNDDSKMLNSFFSEREKREVGRLPLCNPWIQD